MRARGWLMLTVPLLDVMIGEDEDEKEMLSKPGRAGLHEEILWASALLLLLLLYTKYVHTPSHEPVLCRPFVFKFHVVF